MMDKVRKPSNSESYTPPTGIINAAVTAIIDMNSASTATVYMLEGPQF
jgi:hypothetical protein